ncbi:MAG TPA: hypothetical protein VGK19_14380 [Capsulimonadaceae bacterium]
MSKHSDPLGRTIGIVVFLIGIALLFLIAKVAFSMLNNPVPQLNAIISAASHPLKPGQAQTSVAFPAVGAAIVAFLLRLSLLLIGIIAGSIVAGKGIHLYFASASHTTTVALPTAATETGSAPSSSPASASPEASETGAQ